MDHLVIHRPEAVEVEHLFVPSGHGLHLAIFLVTNTVVDVEELRNGNETVERLSFVVRSKARQEGASVVHALHEGVHSVTISLHTRNNHRTVLVL